MKDAQAGRKPRAMTLRGYGLIGAACLRALHLGGFDVIGLGRNATATARIDATFLIQDIAQASARDWACASAAWMLLSMPRWPCKAGRVTP